MTIENLNKTRTLWSVRDRVPSTFDILDHVGGMLHGCYRPNA